MTDIELVIKIPNEVWNKAKEYGHLDICGIELSERVMNGKPLPKGHGDLKDVGQCDRRLFYQRCGGADSLITVKSAFDMLMSLPTIIEADKGSD